MSTPITPQPNWDESVTQNGITIDASLPLIWNSANGSLSIQNASATTSGVVTPTAQTIAGIKTFSSTPSCSNVPTLPADLTNKTYVDSLVAEGVSWQMAVKSFWNFTTPPVSPSNGDRYISSTTTGSFVTNYIYQYQTSTSSWIETIPQEGFALLNEGTSKILIFIPPSWTNMSTALFNQSLNTTDDVTFDTVTLGTTTPTNNNQVPSVLWVNTQIQSIQNLASLNITNTTDATSSLTGQLNVIGGTSLQKSLYVGGNEYVTGQLTINNTTVSTSTLTGSLIVSGGEAVKGSIFVGGNATINAGITGYSVSITNSTDATNNNSGSLICNGGCGIQRTLYTGTFNQTNSGSTNSFAGTLSLLNATTGTTSLGSGSLYVGGGIDCGKQLIVGYGIQQLGAGSTPNTFYTQTQILSNVTSSSTNTGALTVTGGVGIGGDIYSSTLHTSGGIFSFGNNSLAGVTTIQNVTPSTSLTTGALICSGGIGITGNSTFGSAVVNQGLIQSTYNLNSSSTSTGAVLITGGVGIGGNINTGGTITGSSINGQVINAALTGGTSTFSGSVTINNGATISSLIISNTTASTSTNTGALIVDGGLGVGGSINSCT